MATVHRTIRRPRAEVFEALVTPPTYPNWLVGCRKMRAVDASWPEVGSRFHHTVGLVGPLTVDDHSEVLAIADGVELSLEVRALPFGRGRATFRLADGTEPGTTNVTLDEVPIGTLAALRPALDPLVARRNEASLAALAEHVESGHRIS